MGYHPWGYHSSNANLSQNFDFGQNITGNVLPLNVVKQLLGFEFFILDSVCLLQLRLFNIIGRQCIMNTQMNIVVVVSDHIFVLSWKLQYLFPCAFELNVIRIIFSS